MKKNFTIFLIILLFSCNSFNTDKKDDIEVARVYDEYLYFSDLKGIVLHGTTVKDSLSIIKNYINNWIKKQIVLNKAEENLNKEQKVFDKQLEDYRNSLIIYTYKKELIAQKLDTNITEKEIIDYYEKNKGNFELKDNIVKVIYVKVPFSNNHRNINKIRKLYKSEKTEDKEALIEFCNEYAVNYNFNDSLWIFFNDLLKEVPIKTYNHEYYLKNYRYIELKDSLYHYFVNIKGFRIKESVSPLNFEKENIKNIITNKRKVKLVNDMHEEIYNKALKNGDFEIY